MLVCLRTFDPEEADYFFVPTMAGCLYDVYGWNQIPMWPPKIHGGRGMCVMCDVATAFFPLWLGKHLRLCDEHTSAPFQRSLAH